MSFNRGRISGRYRVDMIVGLASDIIELCT